MSSVCCEAWCFECSHFHSNPQSTNVFKLFPRLATELWTRLTFGKVTELLTETESETFKFHCNCYSPDFPVFQQNPRAFRIPHVDPITDVSSRYVEKQDTNMIDCTRAWISDMQSSINSFLRKWCETLYVYQFSVTNINQFRRWTRKPEG